MKRPRTLAGRLFLWQVSVGLVVLIGIGLALGRVLEIEFVNTLTGSLAAQARTIRAALPVDQGALERSVRQLGAAGGVRITVFRTDGVVIADSGNAPGTQENGSHLPEVQEALSSHLGASTRTDAAGGVAVRYVALTPANGRIVRVATPLTAVQQRERDARLAIFAGLAAAAVSAGLGGLVVSHGLSGPLRRAVRSLERLREGDLSARMELGGTREVALLATTVNAIVDKLEDEIRSSSDAQRARDLILSSMEEGIVLAGPDGRVTFANRAAVGHLGAVPEAISALAPLALRQAVGRAAAERTAVPIDVELEAPPRSLRGVAAPAGVDGSVLVVLRDVTEAKRLDAVRRDFVTNASHELKTPVSSIQASAETIRTAASEDPTVVPRFAEQLERDAIRLSRIVSDLLDLSRLETGSDLAERVRLDEVAIDEGARFLDVAAGAGIELRLDVQPAPQVRGSARDLTLLVRNLVDNAIRYTRAGGHVEVTLFPQDAQTVLRVSDTGIGIPSRDLPRIFERFYRVDRARSRDTGGTGLGLSIVKHVTENHGGSVHVTSELGRGSTFEVRLPAAPDAGAGPHH